MGTLIRLPLVMLASLLMFGCKSGAQEKVQQDSPLTPLVASKPKIMDLDIVDSQRNRTIPVRIYLPPIVSPAPVILFSHGLGGSREGSAFLGNHWASRGYISVCIQHPGSDTSVWKGKPLRQRMSAMREAANAQNFLARVKDVPAVLDQLERWNATEGHALSKKLDLTRVGMSGHSFGAVTTQAVCGQGIAGERTPFTDPRIKAALVMSPSSPRKGSAQEAFGAISLPWMLMTGSNDLSPIGDIDMASRLAVFPALPPGGKYELVLHGAEHAAFTDRALPGDKVKRNPNHYRAILALSTAFWDAYLLKSDSALAWLDGNGPRSVLEPDDKWQRK